MVGPVPNQGRSTPAAMCTTPCAEIYQPTPIPPFLLAQNLSSKWIAPTDNMWPKSDDAKSVIGG